MVSRSSGFGGGFAVHLSFSLSCKYVECLLEEQLEITVFHTLEVYVIDFQVRATSTFSGFLSAESTHVQEELTPRESRGLGGPSIKG